MLTFGTRQEIHNNPPTQEFLEKRNNTILLPHLLLAAELESVNIQGYFKVR